MGGVRGTGALIEAVSEAERTPVPLLFPNYTYDADGNMLAKAEIATGNVTTYTWDYRNRLTSVVVKDSNNNVIQQSNYTYDPFDRRIGASFDPDGAGPQPAVQTKTVWDGLNPFADFNGAGALTNRYLERAAAVDQVMASFSATGVIGWHLADQLGSTRDVVDQNGNELDHIQYGSFGEVLSESNPANGDRFKFTGRELDGTGDYYYRARYYNPPIGRFTSEDPTGLGGGDPNVFRYGSNSPTTMVDPTGTDDAPASNGKMDYSNPFYVWWCQHQGSSDGGGATGGVGAANDSGPGVAASAGLGVLQGGANTVNGVQDAAIGTLNIGPWCWNHSLPGWIMPIQYIPSPDWATGKFTHEDPTLHNISKFAGGTGVTTLAGIGWSKYMQAAQAAEQATAAPANTESLLQGHLDAAVERFGAEGLTPKQLAAVAKNPNLEPAFTGERIHTFFGESVGADPALQHLELTPRFQFGPDVVDPLTGRWYDVTTPGQWPAHVLKYGPDGTPLFY